MVAVKGRLNSVTGGATLVPETCNSGQVRNLKIYVDVDKVKRKSTLACAKGNSKPQERIIRCPKVNNSKSCTWNSKRVIKPNKSADSNVGREVLADIANIRSSFTKAEQGKSFKPEKGKTKLMLHPQRNGKTEEMLHQESCRDVEELVRMGARLSDNPSQKNMRQRSSKSIKDNRTLKKSTNQNNKAASYCANVETTIAVGRKSIRVPIHLTRKSLPVLKQASRVEASDAKGNSGNLSRRKHSFHVKPSVRRSIVPKPSNFSNRSSGNRVSDGFVVKALRDQTNLNTRVSSRKSIKPAVKTSITVNNGRKSKSDMFSLKTIRSRPSDLSEGKQDKGFVSEGKQDKASSVSQNIPSVVSNGELAPEEVVSSSTVAMTKSGRRNSFTSSLMSRPKLLKERGKVAPQETLPNIYDDRNHLEVSDYVDDIYHYYWVMEGQNPLPKNYMASPSEVTTQMRGILINWLIEVHMKFDLMEETLFLTVALLDRYLSLENIKKNDMQLVGLTSLLLASKYEDFWHPLVTDLISISADSYSREQMLGMEKTILKKLKFRLNEPTLYVFMLRFLKAAQADIKFEHLAFYLIELCLVKYEALNYKPSMLCASAIYVARCTMHMTPRWTPLLTKHARYQESHIRSCAEMILKFHKAAKTSVLKVTYEKYAKLDRCKVATIKPLDRLPSS